VDEVKLFIMQFTLMIIFAMNGIHHYHRHQESKEIIKLLNEIKNAKIVGDSSSNKDGKTN